jgi:AraC family transcriptional regulator
MGKYREHRLRSVGSTQEQEIILEQALPTGSFFGELLNHYKADGFLLHEVAYSPHLEIPCHTHTNAYFAFVLSGFYTETYGQQRRTCQPTTLIFHPAGEAHADRFADQRGHLVNLELTAPTLERWREHAPVVNRSIEWKGGELTWLATRLYSEFRQRDTASALAMEGLVLEILAGASRSSLLPSGSEPRWLGQIERRLQDEFVTPASVEQMAHDVDVHPVHLARVFRHRHHCTIGEYVRRLRVEAARRPLCDPEITLADIALTTGFVDQSHFARSFKSITGMTPGQYRAVHRSP